MQNSIIVYRNPIEQELYEGTICGYPIILWIIVGAVIMIILFISVGWLSDKYRQFKCKYRKPTNYRDSFDYFPPWLK